MPVIEFVVPAVPVAQPRPRAVSAGKHARIHEVTHVKDKDGVRRPHPVAAFKATVRLAFEAIYQGPPLDGPLILTCLFVMPRPLAKCWKKKEMAREPYTATLNDFDNLAKSFCDALNGIAWHNDGQIYKATIERWIASGAEAPHVEVKIEAEEQAEPEVTDA